MRSLLKTAMLAAILGLGAVGSAEAATVTTTNTYTLGKGSYSVADLVLPNPITATLTFSSVGGGASFSLFANGEKIFSDLIAPSFSRTFSFAAGTKVTAALLLFDLFFGYPLGQPELNVVVTEFETIPDPVPLPATAPLLLGAMAVAGVIARRRKAA